MLIFDFPEGAADAQRPMPRAAAGHAAIRLTFDDSLDVLIARTEAEVRPVLRAVEGATRRGLYAAGFVSYEAAPAFDPAHIVSPASALPLAWFGIYREPLRTPVPRRDARALAAATPPSLRAAITREAYDAAVARVRAAIAEGDVYQVNYTFPLCADVRLHADGETATDAGTDAKSDAAAYALALYDCLAAEGHGGYGAYLDIGTHRLLSFSPELFFARAGDRVTCRPMKGTVARGRWPEEDEARARWLEASEKNRAENVMIVDLVRNDLGRVARVGSVRVSSLCALERYPTVWQMTSTVEADLRPDTPLDELFAALFPCGSVTGAPKISAMRQIAQLEASPRGVYCGAIGLAGPDRAVFNVAIRTLTMDVERESAEYRVGGGVTWDSHSREEYAEALAKAALLRPAPSFSLLETMRLEDGRVLRIERHLARLAASADYFDVPIDVARIRAQLDDCAAARPVGVWRVRLLVARSGDVSVEVTEEPDRRASAASAAGADSAARAIVMLAVEPVDEDDVFLYHKTTNRRIYAMRREAAPPDVFDVLLWNTRGEITEFTIGNVVVEMAGQRWTPPRSSGLLAGTFRAELIESGAIAERVLTRDDVRQADAVWLINAVREWVPVVLKLPRGATTIS